MRRGKPQQQIYRPGSGPLRKSTQDIQESESDTNLLFGQRQFVRAGDRHDDPKFRSEGCSPRDRLTDTDSQTVHPGDTGHQRRPRKPEQMVYVPRPLAQREHPGGPRDHDNMYNGNNRGHEGDRAGNRPRRYSQRRRESDADHREWREKSPGMRQGRQGSEPRGMQDDSWNRNRDRDTRSVEPSYVANRNFNSEKIQAKPPSGRRHSTIGMEQDKRHKPAAIKLENLAPRFRKKFLEEQQQANQNVNVNQNMPLTPEEVSWDGSSLTFQGHPQHKNPSFHQLNPHPQYNMPPLQTPNPGYYTLPNRPRGRGRLQYDYEMPLGAYRPLTPDRSIRSPCNSRPATPPPMGKRGSRPQTPVNQITVNQASVLQTPVNQMPVGQTSVPQTHVTQMPVDQRDQRGGRADWDRAIAADCRVPEVRMVPSVVPSVLPSTNVTERINNIRKSEGRQVPVVGPPQNDQDMSRPVETPQDYRDMYRDASRRNRGKRNGRNWQERRSSSVEHQQDNTLNNPIPIATHQSVEIEKEIIVPPNNNVQINELQEKLEVVSLQEGVVLDITVVSVEEDVDKDETIVENGELTPTPSKPEENSEVQLSPVSQGSEQEEKETEEEHMVEKVAKPPLCTNLDWNEEVEMEHALSDAPTRSSSVTSLQDISVRSTPATAEINSLNHPSGGTSSSSRKKKKSGRRSKSKRRGGGGREAREESRRDLTPTRGRQSSVDQEFKRPEEPRGSRGSGGRRKSRRRDGSFERYRNRSRNASREVSFDRNRHSGSECENWREEILRSRKNSERDDLIHRQRSCDLPDHHDPKLDKRKAGILILPKPENTTRSHPPSDHPRCPEVKRSSHAKTLFDPNNPNKPIVVQSPGTRVSVPGFSDGTEVDPPQMYITDQHGNIRPNWYDENHSDFRLCYFPNLLRDVKKAEMELQCIIDSGALLVSWETVDNYRQFLKEALEYLLCKSMKFCQVTHVENHLWRILYYNIIEITRKALQTDPNNKANFKSFLLYLIDEGTKYFEGLLKLLEESYAFKLNNYLGGNSMQHKPGGLVSLALLAAQKIYLFLGDLGRYREQVNETSSYGKCRQWYIKSHEINPKNGKPYNQLAILAVYSRRKLDAVYFYMRSIMSSNPVQSARENLIALLDDNRKKYEQTEKKRREERLERQRQQMRQKESEEATTPNSLRRETWIHPEGGRRLHLTTQAPTEDRDSEEEDLAALSSVEVNKRFVTSYLNVHCKLITKIGMESFPEAAMQMLKEFRALLQHSPVPVPTNRFLQLLALNMFSIDSTQLKDIHLQSGTGYRSELQERALVISLQMFNLILERCIGILDEYITSSKQEKIDTLPPDVNVLLPAIKVWCDWMLCHTPVWNPPPSTQDFRVGPPGDAWNRLAHLMNLLEKVEQSASAMLTQETKEGYEPVRLPEDVALVGFTPLAYAAAQSPTYAPADADGEQTQLALRLSKLLFFGTVYLCGLEPPVLKLALRGADGDRREYVSVVNEGSSAKRADAEGDGGGDDSPTEEVRNKEILLEDFSGESDTEDPPDVSSNLSSEVQDLLTRKLELEKKKRQQELHRQRVMKILSQSVVSVHLVIKPRYLVPDTNCFIDHIDTIQAIAQAQSYTIMVPIIVLSELEGLSKGLAMHTKPGNSDAQRAQRVATSAKAALDFLRCRHAAVKCVTTRGAVIASATFSTEEDAGTRDGHQVTNDDKILVTCLALCRERVASGAPAQKQKNDGEPRTISRDVVLLTEDRNLRVKAHARDVPTRPLPDFARWAGLPSHHQQGG